MMLRGFQVVSEVWGGALCSIVVSGDPYLPALVQRQGIVAECDQTRCKSFFWARFV